ncbi:MAG TPA: Flp pilus assembly protein CpaB [Thermoleophilaceae bacterium]|nr:Flp pilus assembly protein CpaB [Thermoleophilaceae bacterium]
MTTRRRRGLLLLSVALASGGLAASEVHERERAVAERVGEPVSVLVAARDIRAGARIGRDALALREVPTRFVPPDALASEAGVVGARAGAAIVAGAYVTPSMLEPPNDGERGGSRLRRGERAVTVEVAGPAGVAGVAPGARVDVLVSTEPGADGGRTTVALSGAELLAIAPGGAYGADSGREDAVAGPVGPTALATLRVTLRQAVYLTEADNFARELRLLARPAGER